MPTVFNPTTGRITGSCAYTQTVHLLEGESVCEEDYLFEDHYFKDGVATERPEMGVVVSGTRTIGQEIRFSGIPAGARLQHPDGVATVDDGVVEWSTTVGGTFSFSFELFPYKPREIILEIAA